jgi:hypothetical protein
MKSAVMPNRVVGRVRPERSKSEAQGKRDRQEFHCVLHLEKPSSEFDFIGWTHHIRPRKKAL